jgi:putative endonuclease
MLYTVYLIYSEKHQKHYTGYTSDLPERLISHNILGHGWTSKYRPWKLIYSKEFNSKQEAVSHEKWLKTGIGRDFIKTLQH